MKLYAVFSFSVGYRHRLSEFELQFWYELMCMLSCFSCVWLFATLWTVTSRLLCSWDSPGKNTGEGCHALLQGIFPTQGLNPMSYALAGRFFTTSATWEISNCVIQANTVLNLPQLNSSSLQEWWKFAINLLLNSDYHMVYESLKKKEMPFDIQ